MLKTIGYAAKNSFSSLKPISFNRRAPKKDDVVIDILYCGICHSDIHQVKNEWKNTIYPCVPGHEIIGKVTKVGNDVKKFKIGDIVGVGPMIDSCQDCESCHENLEQYCKKGFLQVYNGNTRYPDKENLTFGGYSSSIVVNENYVLKIPKSLDPARVAPLLCAGTTTFSPLKFWEITKDKKVGVVGLGGLGHIAVQLAKAMGANVTLITSSKTKESKAKKLGADNVIHSNDKHEMESNQNTFDFILSTIPKTHDANPYLDLLKRDGQLCVVGCIAPLEKPIQVQNIIFDRKSLTTSLLGNIKDSQEMLDFCAKHGIMADISLISIDQVNEAYDDISKNKIGFRYVIDMSTLQSQEIDDTITDKTY